MAHLIDTTTGNAAIFVAGEPAWHRLGTVVADCQTSAEAIRLAHLDWSVQQRPVFTQAADGSFVAIPGKRANVRSDTNGVLGVVGNFYRPLQNERCFDFMDSLVGEKLAMFETAGAIKEGRQVWMLARLPDEIRVAGDDVVKPYVLLTNSHDGTGALRLLPTTVRVVCNNTLTLALRTGVAEGLSITHTESLEARIADARQKLGIVNRRMAQFGEESQALAKRSLNQKELTDYFTSLVERRSEKQQHKLLESFLENFDNERNAMPGIKGSLWAAYNAVSEYADHQIKVLGANEDEKLDARVNSIWFGTAATMKAKAWDKAVSLVS